MDRRCICGLTECLCGLAVPSMEGFDYEANGFPTAAKFLADNRALGQTSALPNSFAAAPPVKLGSEEVAGLSPPADDATPTDAPTDASTDATPTDGEVAAVDTAAPGGAPAAQGGAGRFGALPRGGVAHSEFSFFRQERHALDLEVQLDAAVSLEAALYPGSKWKPPCPDDFETHELDVLGASCELQLANDLLDACKEGDTPTVLDLLKEDPLCPSYLGPAGTPLGLAAAHGHVLLVAQLVEKGALLDQKDDDGRTGFWLACSAGFDRVAAALLELGSDPAAADDEGETPFDAAVRAGHDGVVSMLLDCVKACLAGTGEGKDIARPCGGGACSNVSQLDALTSTVLPKHMQLAAAAGHEELANALRRYFESRGLTAESAEQSHERLPPGTRVLLTGLNGRRELNGQLGLVVEWDDAVGRYTVEHDAETMELRPEKVVRAADGAADVMAPSAPADAAGESNCDAWGYDLYGVPIWLRMPTWVDSGAAAVSASEPANLEQPAPPNVPLQQGQGATSTDGEMDALCSAKTGVFSLPIETPPKSSWVITAG